jgi:hypothetical protein
MSEMPLESPAEDVAEQRTDAYPDRTSGAAVRDHAEPPFEADPADVADQAAELPLDEDDYQ